MGGGRASYSHGALGRRGQHSAPQRALARELIRRGHDVHVLTRDSLARAVDADGSTHRPLATAPQWDPATALTDEEETRFIGRHVVGSADYAQDLVSSAKALAPDLCLIDAMLLTCLNAAHEQGLRTGAINHLGWNPQGNVVTRLGALAAQLPGFS